jgi:hypothetical protein
MHRKFVLRSPWLVVVCALALIFAAIALSIVVESLLRNDWAGLAIGAVILVPSAVVTVRAAFARVRVDEDSITSHGYVRTSRVRREEVLSVYCGIAADQTFASAWSTTLVLTGKRRVELTQLAGYGLGKRRNRRVERQTQRLKAWLAEASPPEPADSSA